MLTHDSQPPRNILIIRLSSIGDIILTTPLIRAVHNKFPLARIHYLIFQEYSQLVKYNPHISKVVELPRVRGLAEYKYLGKVLRAQRYDMVIDLHSNLRSFLIKFYGGLNNSFMINKNYLKRWLLVCLKKNIYKTPYSVVNKYFKCVGGLEITEDEKGNELMIDNDTRIKVSRLLSEHNYKNKVIGIAPRSNWETKCWPLNNYTILAKDLLKEGFHIILFGTSSERSACEKIRQACLPEIWNTCGNLDLISCAELIRKCNVLISNDSGPMHIASAVQTPVVAIFGNTCEEFGFYPYHCKSRVISLKMPCKPCHHIGRNKCPKNHFTCMEDIKPERVFGEVLKLLRN
ncbi:MAG: lipopolysaccharide heptosyltransferase II [bacterium]